ncbi:MAG: iron ABC transporter permease, partial [Candidatus Bathyarchaeota archaeon]|nr:iron ABC transporter permease [Candidatus Bathyarchaeota archaeon]
SIAGVLMQNLLRNPLASPYTLGVASGAAFGAALAVIGAELLGAVCPRYLLQLTAFSFALLTLALVYGIARLKDVSIETLILAGIAIGALFSAGVSILMYISGVSLRMLVYWVMGGLWTSSWDNVLAVLPVTILGLVVALFYSWDLNVMAMGEETATTLGVNVKRIKLILLTLSALLTAIVVSVTGTIGFIGLVAPHMARIIIGSDNRLLIPASSLIGAILLLSTDTVARTIVNPTEIPVGILTSMMGAPFFIYLIIKRRKTLWL